MSRMTVALSSRLGLVVLLSAAGCDGGATPETKPHSVKAASDTGGDSPAPVAGPAETEVAAETVAEPTEAEAPREAAAEGPLKSPIIVSAGLDRPQSVVHDPEADVYLVSNLVGEPFAEDGEGFISRLSPSGEMLDQRFADESKRVMLNAPRGIALVDGSLLVTDLDRLIHVNPETGKGETDTSMGATALSAVHAYRKGHVLVDLNVRPDGEKLRDVPKAMPLVVAVPEANGLMSNSFHLFDVQMRKGPRRASGVAVHDDAILVVTAEESGGLWEIRPVENEEGELSAKPKRLGTKKDTPGKLGGIVVLEDGQLLISSQATRTVYRVSRDGTSWTPVVEDVPSPAGIGWDAKRERVLIPCPETNELRIHQL